MINELIIYFINQFKARKITASHERPVPVCNQINESINEKIEAGNVQVCVCVCVQSN